MPQKNILNKSEAYIENRKLRLEIFLNKLLTHKALYDSPDLGIFLNPQYNIIKESEDMNSFNHKKNEILSITTNQVKQKFNYFKQKFNQIAKK